MMVSLDFSSAFDCVVHSKLLNRLQDEFGVSGRCLDWLRSYLEDRSQYASMKEQSEITSLKTGVPQGSVLGPLLFSVYTSPLSRLIASNDLSCHSYADDTTIYFCLKGDMTQKLNVLNKCTSEVKTWLMFQGLLLNSSKSELMVTGTTSQVKHFSEAHEVVSIADSPIVPSSTLRLLGGTFDPNFNFNAHVNNICTSVNIQLRALKHIRKSLDQATANTGATCIIGSRLDYCNSLLAGISNYNLKRLQRLQTHAAKIVLNDYKTAHNRLLSDLHWLPVAQRIDYKISLLTFKAIVAGEPKYISDMLHSYNPARSLRSSRQFLLDQPLSKSALHDRAFSILGPKTFNKLPLDVRRLAFANSVENGQTSFSTFKKQLKTCLFSAAMSDQ